MTLTKPAQPLVVSQRARVCTIATKMELSHLSRGTGHKNLITASMCFSKKTQFKGLPKDTIALFFPLGCHAARSTGAHTSIQSGSSGFGKLAASNASLIECKSEVLAARTAPQLQSKETIAVLSSAISTKIVNVFVFLSTAALRPQVSSPFGKLHVALLSKL